MSEVGGNAPDGKTPTPTGLSGDERAELERLRTEVAELHSHPEESPAPPRRRKGTWRAPVSAVLIVLGCILAPLSVIGIWTANQVSNTNRYVENVSPLIHERHPGGADGQDQRPDKCAPAYPVAHQSGGGHADQ